MGHQAAHCTTGTINWLQFYGEETFRVQPSILPSDMEAMKKARRIDFGVLADKAKEFVEVGRGGGWERL